MKNQTKMNGGNTMKWLQVVDVVDKNGKKNYITTEYHMPRIFPNNIVIRPIAKRSPTKRKCPVKNCIEPDKKICRYFDYSEWTSCTELAEDSAYYCNGHSKVLSIIKPAFDLYAKILRKTSVIRSRAKSACAGMQYQIHGIKHNGYDAVRFYNKEEGINSFYDIDKRKSTIDKERMENKKEYPEGYDPFSKTLNYNKGAIQLRAQFAKNLFHITEEEAQKGRYALGLSTKPILFKAPKPSSYNAYNFASDKIRVPLKRFSQLMYRVCNNENQNMRKEYDDYLRNHLRKLLTTKSLNHKICNFIVNHKKKMITKLKGGTYEKVKRAFIKNLNVYELYKLYVFNRYSLIYHHPRFGRAGHRILTFKCNGQLGKNDCIIKKPAKIRPVQIRVSRSPQKRV